MGYQMKLDEMQETLANAGDPTADGFERALCALGDAMAARIAERFDIEAGETTQEGKAFAGICCPFNPRYKGQPLPEAMNYMDDEEAWSDEGDLPPMPETVPAA